MYSLDLRAVCEKVSNKWLDSGREKKRDSQMSATHREQFLTQTWQISSYYVSTHVTLCVFSLFSPRRGGGLSERLIVQPTERQTDWMKLHLSHVLICSIFFYFLNLVSLNRSLPCRPTVLLPPNRPRHQRTTPPMIWWERQYYLF